MYIPLNQLVNSFFTNKLCPMKTNLLLRTLLITSLGIGLFTCQKDDDFIAVETPQASTYSAGVPLEWFKVFEIVDRSAPGYRPPAAARALAYIGLAGYEAAVQGMPGNKSLAGVLSGLSMPVIAPNTEYHWPTAVNAAYFSMFQNFYPHLQSFENVLIQNRNQLFEIEFARTVDPEVFDRSKAFGVAVANAVYEWSKTDAAGHNAYLNPRPSSYIPPVGPGLWQPTKPDFTPALFPYWGKVRPFGMNSTDLVARQPLPFSEDPNSQFYIQAKETQNWVNKIKSGKDEESHWIAEFWSDDFYKVTFTPPGRWFAIANQVVTNEKPSLAKAVELYAKMGMALADAGIAIWNSKFLYNVERPVHYINRNFDANWESIMNNPYSGVTGITPEFPAYPSGHSGFGGAAATVLTDMFGYQYRMTDNCHKDRTEFRGTPRTFDTFIEMAVENAYSRIPMGVHFRMDCDEGLRLGYLAGKRVLELPWNQ
ncbi:MAG: hypothetical protein KIPDCIKN_00889 [Haliscomenobacter sp.]|jgi:membrane-associated phospholipid phosphatase|nr:hypothetical protein [Haliscomenobacter sp.]